MRICKKCGKTEDIIIFDPHRNRCTPCRKQYDKDRWKIYGKRIGVRKRIRKYRLDNREVLKANGKKKYHEVYKYLNKELKNCSDCHKEIITAYKRQKRCRECMIVYKKYYNKKYYINNKEKIISGNLRRHHQKYKYDPLYVLRRRCGGRIRDVVSGKNKTTPEYLGCSLERLKIYIESKFLEGMSWENKNKWHIDHMMPLCSAKTEKDILKLCHYTNLKPEWIWYNCSKAAEDKKIIFIDIFDIEQYENVPKVKSYMKKTLRQNANECEAKLSEELSGGWQDD